MPLPVNLLELLRNRTVESERIEYKASWNPDPVMRTICAFANDFHNLGGGYIIIGFACDDHGQPVFPPQGIPDNSLDKIQQELLTYCQNFQPPYSPHYSVEQLEGRNLIVISAHGGMNRPYKIPDRVTNKHKTWHYYIRRGSSTIEAKGEDEHELLSLANKIPFDDRAHPVPIETALSQELMLTHLQETGSKLADDGADLPLLELGRQMNLVAGTSEAPLPKNVGLMFFNETPSDYFPYTQIDVVWFPNGPGDDKYEEKIFTGPLARMTREALDYIQRNYLREIVLKQPQRAESLRVWNFPFAALEEALVNAVYHRSYELREPIEVQITPQELFVLSFPGPDRSIRLEDLQSGRAVSRRYRNRRIGEFLKELRLSEGRATGLPRIFKEMKKNGSPSPIFETDEERTTFLIRLPAHPLSHATENAAQPVGPLIDISRIINHAPAKLTGREDEIDWLNTMWTAAARGGSTQAHILSLVGLGGEGKTSLLAHWLVQLAAQGWPECDAVFAWSFYDQRTDVQHAPSSDAFFTAALRFFGDAVTAEEHASAPDQARRLANLVGSQRTLLILDGIETLQYAPTSPMKGGLRDAALLELLNGLASKSKGLCVLTTRLAIPDINAISAQRTLPGLSTEAGTALLQALGVRGEQGEMADMVAAAHGHALSLNLLGRYLVDAHGGDVRQRDKILFYDADQEEGRGTAFRIMDAYVAWLKSEQDSDEDQQRGQRALALLRLFGLFGQAAPIGQLQALWQSPVIPGLTEALMDLSEAQRNISLARLEEAKLISIERDVRQQIIRIVAHPLMRAYFAQKLQVESKAAWQEARRRLLATDPASSADNPD